MLLGYASVHDWWMGDQERIVNALAEAGLTLTHVEFASDQGEAGWDYQKARRFVDLCRAAGITVLIDVNWNDGALREWTDEQYRNHVRSVVNIIGRPGVLFEPVSEPGDPRLTRWHDIALEEWGEAELVCNIGFPGSKLLPGDWKDQHFCDYGQLVSFLDREDSLLIRSTDCTPLLSRSWDEGMVREATQLALDRRSPFLIYDTWPYAEGGPTRFDVIAWMGSAIQGRPAEPPPSPGNGITINAMAQAPWGASGRAFYEPWWITFEELCRRGTVTLIAADWALLPALWPRLGFPDAREKAVWFAFSRSLWNTDWSPATDNDPDLPGLKAAQDQIIAWWENYVARIVGLMQRYLAMRLVIATGNGVDDDETQVELREGTLKRIPETLWERVLDRNELGHPHPEWR